MRSLNSICSPGGPELRILLPPTLSTGVTGMHSMRDVSGWLFPAF